MRLQILFALMILVLARGSWAATYTSTKAGNWSDITVWGGAIPTNGDSTVIAHAVIVDQSVTVGTSPPSTPDGGSSYVPTLANVTGGGSLPGGAYRAVYTNVDSGGKESSRSPESSAFTLTVGNTLRVTLPALPLGVSSRNIYLTAAGGAALSERLYKTGVTATTADLTSASWADGTTAQASAAAIPNASAVQVDSGGSLTVTTGSTLTLRGDLRISATSTVTLQAGSTIAFDSSQSASPSNTPYNGWIGTANGGSGAKLVASGTSTDHITVTSNSSGANGGFLVMYSVGSGGSVTDCGNFDAAYTDFQRLGSSTRDALVNSQQSSSATVFKFSHCTFSECGRVAQSYSTPAAANWSFDYCKWSSSLHATYSLVLLSASNPTGTRRISYCSFDKTLRFPVSGVTITDSVLDTSYDLSATIGTMTLFARNMVRQTGNVSGADLYGSATDIYWLADTDVGNPHITVPRTSGEIRGNVWEYTGPRVGDGGEAILNGTSGTGTILLTLADNIVLPAGAGDDMSGAFNLGSAFNATVTHNTLCAGVQGGLGTGELTQSAGTYSVFKSNLVWWYASGPTGSFGPLKVWKSPAYTVTDVVTPAAATNNGGINLLAGTAGKGYSGSFSTSPGGNDVDLSIADLATAFKDHTRNIAAWAVARGSAAATYAGRVAAARGYLMADPSLVSSSLIPYIRDGFAPKLASLHGTAHDGGDIGAVAYADPMPSTRTTRASGRYVLK